MTKEEKLMAYSMRLDGKTLQEIADHFCVSRQRIHQLLPRDSILCRPESYRGFIYPNITKYLRDSDKTVALFSEEIGVSVSGLRSNLTGKRTLCKSTIDAILRVTGMTYEEAFATASEPHK